MDSPFIIIKNILVDLNCKGKRLDIFINENENDYSRSRIQSIIKSNYVKVDGKIVSNPNFRLKDGQNVEFKVPKPDESKIEPENLNLEILFEDDDLIVVNKPAGMVVHPAPGNYNKTLVNGLMYHCGANLSGIGGVIRPGIVHRIDKDTSGVLVVAKNDDAHHFLSDLFKNHDIDRKYVAICHGALKNSSGTLKTNIGRSNFDRKKMSVVEEGRGKVAITNYRVIKQKNNKISVVECVLETGRTHQIRVHMSHLGCPLVGDVVYTNLTRQRKSFDDENLKNYVINFPRQALHAKSLGFIHPKTRKKLFFEVDIPQDMQTLINMI